MKKKERDLAICQLNAIQTIYASGDTLDIRQAIRALDLNNEECRKLAIENSLDYVAKKIEEHLEK